MSSRSQVRSASDGTAQVTGNPGSGSDVEVASAIDSSIRTSGRDGTRLEEVPAVAGERSLDVDRCSERLLDADREFDEGVADGTRENRAHRGILRPRDARIRRDKPFAA